MAKRKPEETSDNSPTQTGHYTVLARRYRPQQFTDLIGQEHVAQALTNALQSNRVAHAYLFTGARGVGKTSTSRILAKALNCEKGPTPTPCDQCDICRSIAAGEDVDVLEIDGASNRGIDEVREIRQNVQYRPGRARYKIYIIDEVHMLTGPAFNALLKTLEEPPAHVKFILATTEANKIPITILSRCQRFDFANIGVQKISDHLQTILKQENIDAEKEAVELIARRAGGSMRDAESLLDQLLAFGGDKLTAETIHQMLGTAQDDRVTELAALVLSGNPKEALARLSQNLDEGLDVVELLDQLIEYWRDLMVVHCSGLEGQTLSIGSRHQEALQKQAKSVSLDTILAGMDILVATKTKLGRGNPHGQILMEMALVRLGRLGDLLSLSQLSQWLQNPQILAAVSSSATATSSLSAPVKQALPKANFSAPSEVPAKKKVDEVAANPEKVAFGEANLTQLWQLFTEKLGKLVGGDLQRICSPAISGPNILAIRVPARYNTIIARCQERKEQFETALKNITGQTIKVTLEIVEDNSEAVTKDNTTGTIRRTQPKDLSEIPLLKHAMNVLGAQELRQEPGFADYLKAGQDKDNDDATADDSQDETEDSTS